VHTERIFEMIQTVILVEFHNGHINTSI